MKLKVGNRYRRRDGQITGPLSKTGIASYPFKDNQSHHIYNDKGCISDVYEFPQDIVELYSEPTTKR